MSLDDVVNLTITKANSMPTRQGFGTPLLMVYHTVTADLVGTYRSEKALTDAGFALTHPAVKMARKCFSQNPRPREVLIGKRSTPYTQTVEIYPIVTTQGFHYKFTVEAPGGTSWDIDYTVLAAATPATICTALAPLIKNGHADITTTAGTTKVTMSCTAGKLFDLQNLPRMAHLKVLDVTADPGIAADLAAVEAIDSSTWYGVALDYGGKATATAAAAWIEGRRKLLGLDVSDSECADGGVTSDVASVCKAASYARTFSLFSQKQLLSYGALAWMSTRFSFNPGSANWAYVTLVGVMASTLSDTELSALHAKNVNTYATLGGLGCTFEGKVAVGEFNDIVYGTDWLYARIQERVFGVLKAASDNGSKIDMTDSGADIMKAAVLAQLEEGVKNRLLAAEPKPTCTYPKIATIDPADKLERVLPDGEFEATYANAVNKTRIIGRLSI